MNNYNTCVNSFGVQSDKKKERKGKWNVDANNFQFKGLGLYMAGMQQGLNVG